MNYFYDSLLLVVMILMCFYYLAGQSVTILKKCEIGEKRSMIIGESVENI